MRALLFLYHEVLEKKIGLIQGAVRAKRSKRLPVVLTKEEVRRLLSCLSGTPWLMTMLLYGAGLRLMECCRLRVKDLDIPRNQTKKTFDEGWALWPYPTRLSASIQTPAR
jgi:integrase